MKFTVAQISNLIEGEYSGDPNQEIHSFAKIEEGTEGNISFLANYKYEPYIYSTQSSAVIVSEEFVPKSPISPQLIRVKDPYLAFTQLLQTYEKLTSKEMSGQEMPVSIAVSSVLGVNTFIGAFTYISTNAIVGDNSKIHQQCFVGENVKIGKNCIIYPGVKILKDSIIGDNCIIHSGVVIGSDGFGFAPKEDGTYENIPQLGNVKICNSVSIGSNSTIDRATMGSTLLSDGVKLDNLVQIGHNVEIGKNTVIASQSGVSGSTKIGDNCVIGGQVGVGGHITIADGTKISGQSGVGKSIKKPNGSFGGRPLLPINQHLKLLVNLKKSIE
ncbi:MAG: UDP-3-O-(3-hydroxymyristoyl)glucosamine N-acyltransferase [Leadbetterella sp.]